MRIARGRKQRLLFLWLARLAIFAYAFQLTAIDHWHKDISTVEGVQGSSQHRFHCHSDPSGCAEQPGLSGSLAEVQLTPIPPRTTIETAIVVSIPTPDGAFISSAEKPPQYS